MQALVDSPGRRLSWSRFALRIAVCGIALTVVDHAVEARLDPRAADSEWRMPRQLPTSEVAAGVSALERPRTEPLVVFVGGSPAWGDAVPRGAQAVPAQFARLATRSGAPVDVVNLACNGQLVGDSYFLAKRASAAGADLVVVQVTYHNFSRRGRDGDRQRYPELSSLLGVPVREQLAPVLDTEPTPVPDVGGTAERWLRSRWRLYGQREQIAARLLGGPPESQIHAAVSGGPADATADPQAPRDSYVDLDPGLQSVMADEWATDTGFAFSGRDSESVVLKRLCEELAAEGTDVVVYLAPVNLQGLTEMGMLDEPRFTANVRALERLVTTSGAVFVDLNRPQALPMDAFADINHTTAPGSTLTAERLLRATDGRVSALR